MMNFIETISVVVGGVAYGAELTYIAESEHAGMRLDEARVFCGARHINYAEIYRGRILPIFLPDGVGEAMQAELDRQDAEHRADWCDKKAAKCEGSRVSQLLLEAMRERSRAKDLARYLGHAAA